MNLYLLSQDVNIGHYTFDACVVAAPDLETAKNILPQGNLYEGCSEWAVPLHVKVVKIGKAKKGTKQGVILASFNAG